MTVIFHTPPLNYLEGSRSTTRR